MSSFSVDNDGWAGGSESATLLVQSWNGEENEGSEMRYIIWSVNKLLMIFSAWLGGQGRRGEGRTCICVR